MDEWSGWYRLNGSVNPTSEVVIEPLSSNYQYEFNLSTFDFANNSNSSNIVNVTLDQTGPEVAEKANGQNITTPFDWTNSASVTPSINITDVAGIYNRTHQDHSTKYINLTFWDITGSGLAKNYTKVSLTPGSNRSSEYQVDAVSSFGGLNDSTRFNVTLEATDILGNEAKFNWTFRTDFVNPSSVSASGDSQETWLRDNATVTVDCSDSASGPKEVQIAGDYSTSWNQTIPGEFVLTKHGQNNATLKCRDYAGNVNSTRTEEEYWIDTNVPNVASSSPTDDTDTSFTMEVTLTQNESNESGLDSGNTRFWLTGGSGSIGSVDYGGGKIIRVEMSGLDNSENYELNYHILDNVRHNSSADSSSPAYNDIDFDTKSASTSSDDSSSDGSGGTTTVTEDEPSLSLTSLPDSISLNQGGNTSFDFTVENDGDEDLEGIDVNVSVSGLTVSVSDTDFDLDSGSTKDVTTNITAASDTSTGVYQADVTAESDNASDTATVDIEVLVAGTSMQITDSPGDISVAQGNSSEASFDVKNNGDTEVDANLSFNLLGSDIGVLPSSVELESGEVASANVTVTPANTTSIGVYTGTFTASYPGGVENVTVDVKVQPAMQEQRDEITTTLSELEQRLDRQESDFNASEAARLRALVSQASTALENDDYATAADLQKRVEAELGEEPSLLDRLPIVPIAVGLVLLVLLGIGAYMVLPEPHQEASKEHARRAHRKAQKTHSQARQTWSEMGPVRASKQKKDYSPGDKGAVERVKESIGRAIESVGEFFENLGERFEGSAEQEPRRSREQRRETEIRGKEDEKKGRDFDYDYRDR